MIVTVTPNPSIDRTVSLPDRLVRGAVLRVTSVSSEPGGKGVNVARALTLAGLGTVAVLPAAEHDPILAALRSIAEEQYREETSQLPQYQKIWLCPEYRLQREKEDEWLMELCKEITLWIGKAYQKTIKKSVTLGSAEREYLKGVITTHREALR